MDCCRSGLTDCCRESALYGVKGVGSGEGCCHGHLHIPQYILPGGHGEGEGCVCMHVRVCVGVGGVSVAVGLVGVLGRLLGGRGISHAALGQ